MSKRTHQGRIVRSSRRRLAVAVDFGNVTTCVAVFHEYSKDQPAQIWIFEDWPGGKTNRNPTRIKLDARGNVIRWGNQLEPGEDCIEFFKLALDPSQKIPGGNTHERIREKCRAADKSPEEVVTIFLRQVHDTVTKSKTLEARFTEKVLSNAKWEWILTVPAIWSDAAKEATRRAAVAAGMSKNLTIVSEPEAAAIFTLGAVQAFNAEKDDVFINCDIGGGTIDAITYKVLKTSPHLEFSEAAIGDGALEGGMNVDQRFADYLKGRMGPEAFARMQTTGSIWKEVLEVWERIKDTFDGNGDEENRKSSWIRLDSRFDDPESGIKDGRIFLSCEDVSAIFKPTIDKAAELIGSQYQRAALMASGEGPQHLLLVGGGGQWPYVYSELRKRFSGDGGLFVAEATDKEDLPELLVHQPLQGAMAIVQGAAYQAFDGGMVTCRKARRGYALSQEVMWKAGKHDESQKVWDENEHCYRAKVPDWLFRKGEDIPHDETWKTKFYRLFSSAVIDDWNDAYAVQEKLYIYDGDSRNPSLGELTPLCTVTSSEPEFEDQEFPEHAYQTIESTGCVKLTYFLDVRIRGAALEFTIRIDDDLYAKTGAQYE
ncbi:hypothetical protein KVT40_003950 [Elsinoe batatas]|uniref:Actin-like ATPase domain-containing protein n=1 Tax=Elsinoe batatas TaxID=2601811 RepID=A0A8K0L301_9PEZI|nr:hypothetical protein KVT40_003950 [Elsinoe batatas]